jgi:glycosyltransferase involved in cell wall biosynthesis
VVTYVVLLEVNYILAESSHQCATTTRDVFLEKWNEIVNAINRVLFVSHDASRTGAPLLLLSFLKWLKRDGKIPFALVIRGRGPLTGDFQAVCPTFVFDAVWHISNVPRILKVPLRFRFELQVRRLVRWSRKLGISCIYSNTVANADFCSVLKKISRSMITHVHELEYIIQAVATQKEFDRLKSITSSYVAASFSVAENLIANHSIDRSVIAVHHEFIPTSSLTRNITTQEIDSVHREIGVPANTLVVLGSGTIDWRKGSDLFLLMAQKVIASGAPVHFVWVGGSINGAKQMQYDAVRLGITNRFHCTGSVEEPHRYFKAADVFALTSREDPYPLVMLEAAAIGMPIVSFAHSGGSSEFIEQDCGLVVPYLSVDEMADAVIQLISDGDLRLKFGINAAFKVRQRHDIEIAAPRLAEFIMHHIRAT